MDHDEIGVAIPVHTNIHGAAKHILQHSFAVYRVCRETKSALCDAWLASRDFLSTGIIPVLKEDEDDSIVDSDDRDPHGLNDNTSTTLFRKHDTDEDKYRYRYRVIKDGALLGYNRPSEHKVLFRALFVNDKPDPMQPWPDTPYADADASALGARGSTLKASTIHLRNHLHHVLIQCLEEIQEEVQKSKIGLALRPCNNLRGKSRRRSSSSDDDDHPTNPRVQKKRRFAQKSLSLTSTYSALKQRLNPAPAASPFISAHCKCPLDYFFYHAPNKNVINCSRHVDRGVLICISLTNVIGLEVRSNRSGQWIYPEKIVCKESLYHERNDAGCSDLICILSGDQLKNVVRNCCKKDVDLDKNEMWNEELVLGEACELFPGLNACIHGVRQKLSASRLSISYELRAAPNSLQDSH